MCGIFGILNARSKPVDRAQLSRVAARLAHRGPDGEGMWIDGAVGLAHRRLAIIGLGEQGSQPMVRGDLVLTYNGEIYNYLELRAQLAKLGHRFRTETDAEVLLASYQEWGADCLQHLRGMWAFAIYDRKRQELFLARDRFGIKPLFYATTGQGFFFSSEILPLLAAGVRAEPNEGIALEYLVAGLSDHRQQTFFEGIDQLPGGCSALLAMAGGTDLKITRYYDLAAVTRQPCCVEEYVSAFETSMDLHMRSDVRVGTCLSGGLDSSIVAALGARANTGKDRFYAITARTTESGRDESPFAGMVAEHCDLDWSVLTPTTDDFVSQIEACLASQQEPVLGPSVFMQYMVMKTAHERSIKVLLDGQGGDETLLGYERYYPLFFADLLRRGKLISAAREFFLASRHSKLSLRQLAVFSMYFRFPLVRRTRLGRRSEYLNRQTLARGLEGARAFESGPSTVHGEQMQELISRQLPRLLRYEDRSSMAWSIEARVPFVDHVCVETALRLAPEDRIRNGYTKHPSRLLADRVLPKAVAWRTNKLGFVAPEATWLPLLSARMCAVVGGSPLLSSWMDRKPDWESLDAASRWRLYNLAMWEKQFLAS